MKKPTTPITAHADWDYDLIDRVARGVEHSDLHVFGALTFVAVPESKGGDPDDPATSIGLDFAMVTDGRRGWLALVAADEECDWGPETNELLDELVGEVGATDAAPHVALAVNVYRSTPPVEEAVELRDDRQRRIEALFESHFGDVPEREPEAFSWMEKAMKAFGFGWMTESEIRERMNEGPEEGFGASHGSVVEEDAMPDGPFFEVRTTVLSELPPAYMNRHERRKQKALARKSRR